MPQHHRCAVHLMHLTHRHQVAPINPAFFSALAEQRIDRVAVWGQLPVGASVTKGDSLFPRLDEAP